MEITGLDFLKKVNIWQIGPASYFSKESSKKIIIVSNTAYI